MRFSASACLLALPVMGVAADGLLDGYKAQFQNFLGSFGAKAPEAPKADAAEAAETPASAKKVEMLTLDTWKQTLYSPVKPDAAKPEEWWVLITGRNKTCFGHCLKVEAAFNESAAKFATLPKAPHMAYVNCEDQAILCNSWSASPGSLWIFEMLPPPAKINLYQRRLNLTTTTSETLLDLHSQESKEGFRLYEGYFHPIDGVLATRGLAVPIGYALWALNIVPSWLMMLVISFVSRSMMSRRMNNVQNRPAAAGAAPGDAAGAR